jgi:nitrogen fixation protein FixH
MENVAPRKSDKYIPYYFVAFFVFLAIADGFFVYLATSTHTGVVKEQAYEKGLDYNQVVKAKAVQDALGWEGTIIYENNTLQFTLQDRSGQPLQAEEVTAHFHRPIQAGADFSVTLQPANLGFYSVEVKVPYRGQWDVTVSAIKGEDHYQKRQRILVR